MNTEQIIQTGAETSTASLASLATLTPEEEGLKIRRALRCLQSCDVHALWVDELIAHVQGKKLIQHDYEDEGRPKTNIKTYITNGVSILLTMFAVDEDLEFEHRFHKFDIAGFRKADSSELLKPVEEWSPDYDEYECDYTYNPAGYNSHMTPARRKRVLDLLTSTGLLDRKPNINPTTLVIRLRGDRIVDTLKRISPRGYADLTY